MRELRLTQTRDGRSQDCDSHSQRQSVGALKRGTVLGRMYCTVPRLGTSAYSIRVSLALVAMIITSSPSGSRHDCRLKCVALAVSRHSAKERTHSSFWKIIPASDYYSCLRGRGARGNHPHVLSVRTRLLQCAWRYKSICPWYRYLGTNQPRSTQPSFSGQSGFLVGMASSPSHRCDGKKNISSRPRHGTRSYPNIHQRSFRQTG